jgi:NAD(P)-dependent dehydrogenase (short-subunit alcohol dehydrogenase family)
VLIRSPRLVDDEGMPISRDVLMANLDVHVVGPFNLARLAAAFFATNVPDDDGQRGVIVQTASISALDGQETMVPYAAAKGAIASMTLPMARDLAPIGVRVCAIAPGSFLTPLTSSRFVQQLLLEDILFPRRLGYPDEYSSLVEVIIRNPYLNAEVIRLDGGARLSIAMGSRSA